MKDDLSTRLRSMRNMLHLTQTALAERVGITQPYLAELERGDKRPSLDVLQKLCGELNCSADYLLGLPDSKSYRPMREEPLPAGLPRGITSEVLRIVAERHISGRELELALDLLEVAREDREKK